MQIADKLGYQLHNLHAQCQSFCQKTNWMAYQPISVVLRTLLIGSSGDAALATQAFDDIRLFPLTVEPDPTKPDYLRLPADVTISTQGGGSLVMSAGSNGKNLFVENGAVANSSFGQMFDEAKQPIPLAEWLTQPFLRSDWTLSMFIRAVAHGAGGAHVEARNADLRAIIEALDAWGSCYWHITPGIGRSVHPQLVAQYAAAYPGHQPSLP